VIEDPESTQSPDAAERPLDQDPNPPLATESEMSAEPAAPEDVAATAEEFVAGLLEAMGLEAEVTRSIEGDSAALDVTGEDLGVLIGRRGQTLDALQELTRTAVQRRLRTRVRLMVDVEGYRARRRDSLADYARSIAERAKSRGTEIELEPMSSWDRKIVHDAVSDIEGVVSFSEGVDPNRKVVIRAE
jgi:spoIIIJ-associated protein